MADTQNTMINFYVTDGAGNVLRIGTCQTSDFASQASTGEFVNEGVPNINVPTVTYTNQMPRAQEYPGIGDQLDALWKYISTLDQTSLPTPVADMLGKIQSVKTAYPAGTVYVKDPSGSGYIKQ